MLKISSKISILVILLLVLSLSFNYAKTGKCPSITCGNNSLEDGICVKLSPSVNHSEDTISLLQCSGDKICSYNLHSYLELKSLTEDKTISCTETKNEKYGGEDCSSDSDCSSINLIDTDLKAKDPAKCINNKCESNSLNSGCNDDGASCPKGATCEVSSKKCVELLKEGTECKLSYECGFNLLCNNEKCTSLFSLDDETTISTDEEANKGLLCKSGYVYENKCAKMTYKDAIKINQDGIVECELDSECEYNIIYSDNKVEATIKQACTCGHSGTSFCPIPYNNEDSKYYQNYLTALKEYYSELSTNDKYNIKNKLTVYDESVNKLKALFTDYTVLDCVLEVMQIINTKNLANYEIKSLSSNLKHTFDVKKKEAYVIMYTNLNEIINNNKITLLLSEFYENIVIGVSYTLVSYDNLEFTFESGKSKLFQFEALIHKLFTLDEEQKGLFFYIYLKEESDKDSFPITLSISNTKDDLYMMGYNLLYSNGNAFDNLFTMNLTLKKKQSAIFLLDYKNISYDEGTTFFIGDLYNNNSNIKISYSVHNTVTIYDTNTAEDLIQSYFYPSNAEYSSIEVNSEVDLLSILKNNNNLPIIVKVENNEDVNYEYSTHSNFFILPVKSVKELNIDSKISSYFVLKLTATNQAISLLLNNSEAEFGSYIKNTSSENKLKFAINSYTEDITTHGSCFYNSNTQESAQSSNTIIISSIEELKDSKTINVIVNIFPKTTKYKQISEQRTEVDNDSDNLYYITLNTKDGLNMQENIIEITSNSIGFTKASYEIVLNNKEDFLNKNPSEIEAHLKSYKLGNSKSLLYDFSFLNNFNKNDFVYVIFTFKSDTKEQISTYAYQKTVSVIDTEASDNFYVKLENSENNFYHNTILVKTPSTYEVSNKFLLTNIISHQSMIQNSYFAIGSDNIKLVGNSQYHSISEDTSNKTPYEVKTDTDVIRKKIFVKVFGFINGNIADSNANIYVSNTFVNSMDTIKNIDFESYEKLVHITVPKSTIDNDFTAQIFIDDFARDKEGNSLPNKYYVNYKYKKDVSDAKYDTSSLYNYLNKGYDTTSITFENNSSAYELTPLNNGVYDFIVIGENIKTKILGFYTPAVNKYFAQSLILDDYSTIKIEKSVSNIYYFKLSQTSKSLFYLYFGNLTKNIVSSKKFDLIKINLTGENTTTALFSEDNEFDTRQKFEIDTLKEGEEALTYIVKVTLTFKSEDPEKEIDEDEDQDEGIKSFDLILNNFASDSTDQMLTINELDNQTVTLKSSTIFKQVKLLSNMQIYKLYIKSDEKDLVNTVEFKSDKSQKTITQDLIYPTDPQTKEISLSFLSSDFNVEENEETSTYSSSIIINLSENSIKEISDVNNIKNIYVYLFNSSKPARKVCPIFFCDVLDKDRCFEKKPLQYETEISFAYDIYKCQTSDKSYCPVNIENYESQDEDAFCTNLEPSHLSYIGSYCNFNYQCLLGSCINNICVLDEEIKECKDDSQCKVGYFCNSTTTTKECEAQKDKDSECKDTKECKNNSVCYKNKCVEFYSLENGSETIDLGTIVNKFCKSGFAVNNKCTELYLKSDITKGCILDSDCIYNNSTGEKIKVENSCECGFNEDNKQYCLAGNTKEYSDYITKIKEKYTNPHCHTLERDNCNSLIYNPELQNTIRQLEMETIYKNKLIEPSSCVEDYFFALKTYPKPDPKNNQCNISCSSKENNGECISKQSNSNSSNFDFFNCSDSNQYCDYDSYKLFSNSQYNGECVSNNELRYPGEYCIKNSECTNNCVNNICSKLDSDNCSDSSSCNVGEFCDKEGTKKCVKQRILYEQCNEAFDCLNNLVCYDNKCVLPFSLDIGTNIEKQDEFSKKYLCSTDYYNNNICSALKYSKYYNIENDGLVACNSQSKCNFLIQNEKEGEWKDFTQDCSCSLNDTYEAYCPYSTSDEATSVRNSKLIELKKSLLDNNRHTLNREKGNINEHRENLSLECIDFNSYSYYKNMSDCVKNNLGFTRCSDIIEDKKYYDYINLPVNEIYNFKNDKERVNISINQKSKFYLYSSKSNNKSAIDKIEIKSYPNEVLDVIEGSVISENNIYESEVVTYETDEIMIISIIFKKDFADEVDFYLYTEDYTNHPKYLYYKYIKTDLSYDTMTIGNVASFDYSKPTSFILDLNHYKDNFYDNQINNSIQTLYEIEEEFENKNSFLSALIFNTNVLSARAVAIDFETVKTNYINFEDYTTIYNSDEDNVLYFSKDYFKNYLFVEITFKAEKEVMKNSSAIQIIKPLIRNSHCNGNIKELSIKINTLKKSVKSLFQGIELCEEYNFVYNSLKIYANNNKNIRVSIGYGKINVNNLISKEADYDLSNNPIQTVVLDKEKLANNKIYISLFYDGYTEDDIYFSLGISDDKIISFSDVGFSYYYNINNEEKVYLLFKNNDENKKSFIFQSLVNKPNINKAVIDKILDYKTIDDLKTKTKLETTIDSQIDIDSSGIGYKMFVLSATEANQIVSGKFIIKTLDSTTPSDSLLRLLADETLEFNKDILIVASKTKSKTIQFNQGEQVYRFDLTLLNGDKAEIYLNDDTIMYKQLSINDSIISIIQRDLVKITIKINSEDDIDTYILVSSATKLDTTNKIVTKNKETVINSESNKNYSTLIFKITEKTQFNYINIQSIEGKIEAIEKTIIPINTNDNAIYFTEIDNITSTEELTDPSEYYLYLENPTEKSFYVLLRVLTKSTLNAINSYRANYSSDVLISLESGKTSESLSFPKSRKTTKKFEISSVNTQYLSLNIARSNLTPKVSCSIVVNNKEPQYYSSFFANNLLSKIAYENKRDGESSIILTCDNSSSEDLNVYVIGANVPKRYASSLMKTDYFVETNMGSDYIELEYDISEKYLPSSSSFNSKVNYYAIVKESDTNLIFSYYDYIANRDKYVLLVDFKLDFNFGELKKDVTYYTNIVATETTYNLPALYDTITFTYDAEDPSSSSSETSSDTETSSSTDTSSDTEISSSTDTSSGTQTSSSSSEQNKNGMSFWIVLLIILAVICIVALVLLGLKYIMNMRRSNQEDNTRALINDYNRNTINNDI